MYIPSWPCLTADQRAHKNGRSRLPFPLETANRKHFYVARSGIYHLSRALRLHEGGTVLAPDYHHGNEIYALRAAGARIQYYPVKKNLDVDLDRVAELCRSKPRVLYVTHFIGWPQPMAELQALCRDKGIILIEDCALSFMSGYGGKALGTFGDYSVFCLYKSLPLPNGGVLARNNGDAADLERVDLGECSRLSVAGRSLELMLQWFRLHYENCGRALVTLKRTMGRALSAGRIRRVPVGDTGFDLSAVNIGMSSFCHKLLPRFPYDWIKRVRRRNFQRLQQRLSGMVTLLEKDLSDDVCPLFFPLLVSDKQAAACALAAKGIQTIEFWNGGDDEARRHGSDADFLRRHLLEVPIHQDVTDDAVNYMAEQILKSRLGMPA